MSRFSDLYNPKKVEKVKKVEAATPTPPASKTESTPKKIKII